MEQDADNFQADHIEVSSAPASFEKAAAAFLKSRQPVLSPATVRNYVSSSKCLNEYFPWFYEMQVYMISTNELQQIVDALVLRGEICALTMNDISGNVIHVCNDVVRGADRNWVTKPPKTFTSDRYITMPSHVIDLIREQGYVTNYHPDHLSYRFQTILKENHIPPFRFHDLRHPYVKHTTKIFSLRLMDFQAQAYNKNRFAHF